MSLTLPSLISPSLPLHGCSLPLPHTPRPSLSKACSEARSHDPPHAQGSFSTHRGPSPRRCVRWACARPCPPLEGRALAPPRLPSPVSTPPVGVLTRSTAVPSTPSLYPQEPGLEDRSPHPPPSASPTPSLCLSSSRTLPYGAVAGRLYSFSCQLLQARTSGTLWGPRTPIALSSDVCPSH